MLFSILPCDYFLDTSTASIGIRARFILDKMPPRRRPANEVPVEEVYDHDCMTRLKQRIEAFNQQYQTFFATQNQHNHNPYNLGDDFQGIDEDFKETGKNYFELEPLFDTSDIVEYDDRLDLVPKFDLSDAEDEDEFDECE